MGQDQFGIGTMLASAIDMMAGAASIAMLLCIGFVIASAIAVARGHAESWTKNR